MKIQGTEPGLSAFVPSQGASRPAGTSAPGTAPSLSQIARDLTELVSGQRHPADEPPLDVETLEVPAFGSPVRENDPRYASLHSTQAPSGRPQR